MRCRLLLTTACVLVPVVPTFAEIAVRPAEVVAISANAELLRTGEYRATGVRRVASYDYQLGADDARSGSPRFQGDPKQYFEKVRRQEELAPAAGAFDPSAGGQDSPAIRFRDFEDRSNYRMRAYDVVIESAFDYDTQRLAFRRNWEQTEGETSVSRRRRAWFVGTPERTLLVRGHDNPDLEVSIQGPVKSPVEVSRFFQPVFDARSIAWGGLGRLGVHGDAAFLASRDADEIIVVDEGNGIRRLETFQLIDGNPEVPGILSTWWIDERQGFQPVRFVRKGHRSNPTTPAEKAYNQTAKIREESDFSWTEIDGVWILQNLDMRRNSPGIVEHLQLALDWKSVNQPISAEHFDWRSWSLPDKSRVVDLRMGADRPIVVERVGSSQEAALPPLAPEGSGTARRYLVIGNLIVLGFAAGWFLRRKFRKPRI